MLNQRKLIFLRIIFQAKRWYQPAKKSSIPPKVLETREKKEERKGRALKRKRCSTFEAGFYSDRPKKLNVKS